MTEDQLNQAENLLVELERVEQQLQQMHEGLRQSHRLATLGTMSAIIAHEFNNILTPVISYCQLALANADGDQPDLPLMRKALQRSLAGAEKAAQISASMLGFAREGTDGPARANIGQVVEEVFTCLAREPARDGITLQLDIPPDAEVAISPVALQQVLLNLVLNARTAMRHTRGRLTIRAQRASGDTMTISVADTGPGICAELLPRIFEPFVTHAHQPPEHAVATAVPPRKGTGLGLAICRDLITQACGTITVVSEPNQGTTFQITLPRPADDSRR